MNLMKDWKKQASQQFHKDEIEKAFMDQAYAFIQNKAGRLLSDPHRLGFEIVFKNEACTRMVGIFAFRAGDRLLYVPCFFINGQVKGTDLLYDVDRKMFRPLDEEQVEFVLEAQSTRQGKGYKNDNYMQRSMDVHKLVVPPSGRGVKFASEDEIQQDLQEMAKKAELQPILRNFIEDTGELTLEAIEETMKKSGAFARALTRLDDGIWEPLPAKKQASEEPPADEGLFLIKGFGKFASDDLTQSHITKRGFSLEDSRNDLNTVEVDDVELQNISDPGVYDVVLADGTARRAFCIPDAETYYEGLHDDETEWAIGDRDRQHPPTLCIFEDGSVSRSDYRKPVYGMPRDEQPEEIKEPPTKEADFKNVLNDQLGTPVEHIKDEDSLSGMGVDMLDMVEMVMRLEEDYGIRIPDEVVENFQTVGDVENYLNSLGQEKAAMYDPFSLAVGMSLSQGNQLPFSVVNESLDRMSAEIRAIDRKDPERREKIRRAKQRHREEMELRRTKPWRFDPDFFAGKEASMKGITDDPSSGYYHVYDPTTKCCVFLNIKSKRTNNGITTYTAARGSHKDSQTYELVHNPDTQTGSKEGDTVFLSNQTKFIKGKPEDPSGAWSFCCKKGPALGNEDSIDRFLLSTDNVPAKLKASEKSAGMRFELSIGGRTTEDIDDLSMAVKLARDLKIPGDQALALLDMAEKQGSVKFWMQKANLIKAGAADLLPEEELSLAMEEEPTLSEEILAPGATWSEEEDELMRSDPEAAFKAMGFQMVIPDGSGNFLLNKTGDPRDWQIWDHEGGGLQPIGPREKAASMRLMDDPTFDRDFDSDYGTELDPGHAYALDVGQTQEPMRGRRIGDQADPEGFESRREAVLTQTPEQLAQMAKMQQLPNLFEHGVVGALANAYDAVVLIDRYIPDLEKAVDGLGRALFLFYWKPGEFQDAYGVDDMQNLEDELLSNFKALGDLTLNLSKRSSQPVGPGVASQI